MTMDDLLSYQPLISWAEPIKTHSSLGRSEKVKQGENCLKKDQMVFIQKQSNNLYKLLKKSKTCQVPNLCGDNEEKKLIILQ